MSIATRIHTLGDRVTSVSKNILEKIDQEVGEVKIMMKAGFDAVDARLATVDERFDAVDARFTQIDERFDAVDGRFTQIDGRFGQMDDRFGEVDHRLSLVDGRLDIMQTNINGLMDAVAKINKDSTRRDLRIDKIEKRLEAHDERFDRLESILVRIDAKLPDPQPITNEQTG
ncbi:hypothetical protein ACQEVF_36410 [Nonomuraea polychroma]|uniref:hypothetical protein n=1 Tax=Nonomuraea polychroma TaxID=46176 RepID=UPI003D8ABDAC